jgi:hypothetical protein
MAVDKDKKVKKNYRIRADIDAELQGLMILLNKDAKEKVTETTVIEAAIADFCKRFKQKLTGK